MQDLTLFILAGFAVVMAGSMLAVFADVIVRHTRIGVLWFGGVAVALVTSLPELVTDISAISEGNHELAMGDIVGSNMANMAILAAMTLVFTTRRLLQRAALESILSAMLAIALTGTAIVFISLESAPEMGNVGLGTIVLFGVYAFGTFAIRERQNAADLDASEPLVSFLTLRQAQAGFVLAAAMILLAGPQLATSADALAEDTGLGESFFGAAALAMVTSLPELAVSVSALRIGAQNLAIANLLGSNATNMALLLPLDIAYTDGALLEAANTSVLVAAGTGVVLMSIATVAIVLKAEPRRLPVDRAAVLILVAYVVGLWATYGA